MNLNLSATQRRRPCFLLLKTLGLPKAPFLMLVAFTLLLFPSFGFASQRPIQEFIVAQGTDVPGVYFYWTDPAATDGADIARWDYAGIDEQQLIQAGLPALGTSISGSITE